MSAPKAAPALTEPPFVRRLLIGAAALWLGGLILLPLATVFAAAARGGLAAAWRTLADPDTLAAIRLTALTIAIVVPVNTVCGVAAAWAIAKFRFPGRGVLATCLDLPFAVSPVIAGLMIVLLYGVHGWFGPALAARGWHVVFAVPGIVLATVFVTFPFVARELIPLMQAQGTEQEEAAVSMGASGWQVFRRVTLPNIRWGVLLGAIQCGARALGEFGAASVVSGHIRGLTDTLPLHAQVLYEEYHASAAFTVSCLLALCGLAALGLRRLLEARSGGGRAR